MSKFNPDIDAAIVTGFSRGFEVIQSTRNTLLLDIDSEDDFNRYKFALPLVMEFLNIKEIQMWESKGLAGHRHILITLNEDLHVLTRIALQAALGSDPRREIFAIERVKAGISEPSLLFRPKDAVVKSDALEDIPF